MAAGVAWAVVVLCLDLSLMTAAPDGRRLSRLVTFGSRAIVSVLAALTFASALVMFMFAKDIATQVARDQQTDLAGRDDGLGPAPIRLRQVTEYFWVRPLLAAPSRGSDQPDPPRRPRCA